MMRNNLPETNLAITLWLEPGANCRGAVHTTRSVAFTTRAFTTILICGAVLILAGCKTESHSGIDPAQELSAAKVAEAPLPATTPFDSLPSERAAYLEAYRDGYRSGLVSLNGLIGQPAVGDSYYAARTNGWQTDVSAGFRAHFAEVMQRGHQQ